MPGVYQVTASAGGRVARATVFLDYHIVEIVVTPTEVALGPGASQQFHARGVDMTNDTVDIRVVWSATGGTITPDGFFTAGPMAAEWKVVAERAPPEIEGVAIDWLPRRAAVGGRPR